jgi:hypothetical protein
LVTGHQVSEDIGVFSQSLKGKLRPRDAICWIVPWPGGTNSGWVTQDLNPLRQ